MEHRVRVNKESLDGTTFSIEITGLHLDSILKDAFGSLRSFNEEIDKQQGVGRNSSNTKE